MLPISKRPMELFWAYILEGKNPRGQESFVLHIYII